MEVVESADSVVTQLNNLECKCIHVDSMAFRLQLASFRRVSHAHTKFKLLLMRAPP